ncbi:MAG: nucleotide exchange factor GrpE [Clostridia bacterium]
MEELEKDINKCDCCHKCDCGDDCNCTADNKCCEECTCDSNCKCECDKTEEEEIDNDACECEQDAEDVSVFEDVDDCSDEFAEDCDNQTSETDYTANQVEEDDKCKCGCGESVEEESTADAYFKQLLSLRAEFDNYRKRTQNDISKAYSNGFNQAITEFLPALDSFKMATEYITDPNTLMGIQYIEKGILNTLEKIGVKAIDVSGKFDPNFHQAIGSEVSPDHESGDIIKECFKGFVMGDKVIRYSQVIVAK